MPKRGRRHARRRKRPGMLVAKDSLPVVSDPSCRLFAVGSSRAFGQSPAPRVSRRRSETGERTALPLILLPEEYNQWQDREHGTHLAPVGSPTVLS